MEVLDYSVDKAENGLGQSHDLAGLVDQDALGTIKDGMYTVADWEPSRKADQAEDDKIQNILSSARTKKQDTETGSLGTLGSIFARLTGSKTFTEADLQPVLEAMKQHLMKKNVAKEIADKVCEGVGENLLGKKAGSFQSKHRTLLFSGSVDIRFP